MDYYYLNELIVLGGTKAMRHHKFNNDETDWNLIYSVVEPEPKLLAGAGARAGILKFRLQLLALGQTK
jgi:hypothetical protein